MLNHVNSLGIINGIKQDREYLCKYTYNSYNKRTSLFFAKFLGKLRNIVAEIFVFSILANVSLFSTSERGPWGGGGSYSHFPAQILTKSHRRYACLVQILIQGHFGLDPRLKGRGEMKLWAI